MNTMNTVERMTQKELNARVRWATQRGLVKECYLPAKQRKAKREELAGILDKVETNDLICMIMCAQSGANAIFEIDGIPYEFVGEEFIALANAVIAKKFDL